MTHPPVGQAWAPAPGVTSVLAPNPSPMTFWGTNSYLVGSETLAVIDPGPDSDSHLDALLAAIDGRPVSHILITHAHLDHSPLARRLSDRCSAPVLGFGPATAGRSAQMQALAAEGMIGGGEGVDTSFAPDATLRDGDTIQGSDWTLNVIATPGHFAGHLSFALGDVLFSGDHAMGWASTLISPPDGDLTAFMASCDKLLALPHQLYLPGHGAPIETPHARLRWLIDHRRAREAQILAALSQGPATLEALTASIYTDTPDSLKAAASRNVLAHLIDLEGRNLITAHPSLAPGARFSQR